LLAGIIYLASKIILKIIQEIYKNVHYGQLYLKIEQTILTDRVSDQR
jgi:hypothetical protein